VPAWPGGRAERQVQEFADFLGSQPPFDALSGDDLDRLARQVEVEYFAAGTMIVPAGSPPLDHVYVIRTGAVEMLDRGRMVDLLGPGDTFGHISLLTGLAPPMSARAAEDTLCYRLPDPRTVVTDPAALHFSHYGTRIARERLTGFGLLTGPQAPVTRHMRQIVWCDAAAPVREVAAAVTRADQSCALIRTPQGLGIVTDQDFRSRVATAKVSADAPVSQVMSMPVSTVPSDATLAAAFVQMVKAGVHHLVVCDAGDEPIGVLRAMDLASVEVRDPLLIRTAIDAAASISELSQACQLLPATIVELHDTGVPAEHIGALHAALTDAILGRLLALSGEPGAPRPPCSWLVLGSMARHEPLPASDVDTGIVWADPAGADPGEDIRKGATRVLADLEQCGLHRCPDGANADNPLFSRSRSAWAAAARRWISDPTREGALLLSSIAADCRPITEVAIGRAVTDTIRQTTRGTDYLDALLHFTLTTRPPTGFVRDFVVEHSGEHRGDLDLKRGGLRPISALARWLAIATGEVRGSTPDRLSHAVDAHLLTAAEAEALAGAFRDIYELLLRQEVAAIRDGREPSAWIAPRDLDPLTRRHLRDSFRAISAVQAELDGGWKMRMRKA
jgi:CBS domain-containing protein